MIIDIIKIGNSRGIRIPAAMLRECKIEKQAEIEMENDSIIIRPNVECKSRQGWDKAMNMMHERGDDRLLIEEYLSPEMEEWEWK
ncbi:MAG: AbrB/MazE/SpoVT family DNA-binding domain-containing protein [Nitrospirota bacterium]